MDHRGRRAPGFTMKIVSLPPSVRPDNITLINSQVAAGNVTKVPGTAHLYSTHLAPGLLLVALRSWNDVSMCQGVLALSGNAVSPAVTLAVDSAFPMSTPSRVVSSTYTAFARRPVVVDSHYDYPPGSKVVYRANTMWGDNGMETVKVPVPSIVIGSQEYATTSVVLCCFGIITGATFGSHFGAALNWNSGSVVLAPDGSGNTRHIVGHTSTEILGSLTTGVRRTLGSLATERKAYVLDGIPAEMASKASDVYDEWVASHWAMGREIFLGTTVQLASVQGGPISLGFIGSVSHSQVSSGIPFDGSWADSPHTPTPPSIVTRTGTWPNGDRFLVSSNSVGGRAYIGHNYSYNGDGISYTPPNPGFNSEVWLQAMFLARTDVKGATGLDAGLTVGNMAPMPANPAPDLSSLDGAVFAAQVADSDFGVSENDARIHMMNGEDGAIDQQMLAGVVLSAMRVLDKKLKASF